MELIAVFLSGVFLTLALTKIFSKPKIVGTLRIDQSDPDDVPYLFAELEVPVEVLMRREYVVMKVNVEDYVSHE